MENAQEVINRQKEFIRKGHTRSLSFRLRSLNILKTAIEQNETQIIKALSEDTGKTETESYASEVGFVLSDINHAIRNLHRWNREKRRRTPLIAWPGRSFIYPEPYGSALIIGPWNYPFQLLISPLTGAIAAGNCVVIKPSEFAPATCKALQAMFKDLFPEEYIAVVQGDWRAAKELVQRDFDFIFFTGSTHVGREVMSAAAENLTPVTLELGGKCPCIVCSDADIEVAGRRIAWGKLLNSGQTCVAPDYVLVEKHIRESFLKRLKESFCGNASNAGESMQRIINATHFERLVSYLEHGTVFAGGKYNRDKLQISPTIMVQVDRNSKLMHEEIFGPILPVITCENLDEAIHTVQAGPKPLALYLFASNKRAHQRIVAETSSGGLCINDTVSHLLNKELPFGGVGHSGMGSYHGKAGFDCFTHFKSALKRSTLIDPDQYTRNNKAPLSALKRMYSFLLR